MSQVGFARALGASPRSGQRWISGEVRPRRAYLAALARLLAPVDRDLAELVANHAHVTLEPPAPPPPPAPAPDARATRAIADAIVCAAAESIDVSPRLARKALVAALERAREIGVALDEALATTSKTT